jgi:lipopolysaccharide export LptBFGC system permease protein LptF
MLGVLIGFMICILMVAFSPFIAQGSFSGTIIVSIVSTVFLVLLVFLEMETEEKQLKEVKG